MQLFFFVNHKALGRRGTETAKLLQLPPSLAYIVLSLRNVGTWPKGQGGVPNGADTRREHHHWGSVSGGFPWAAVA